MSRKFDCALLANVPANRAGKVALEILTKLQIRFTPEEQMAGTAIILALLQRQTGTRASEVLEIARRMLDDDEFNHAELRGASLYLYHEISKGTKCRPGRN